MPSAIKSRLLVDSREITVKKSFLKLELTKKEDLRRTKNPIVHRAAESKARESADRMKDDLKLINNLWKSIERDASDVRSCTRLGKKLEEKDNIEPETRSLRITLETIDDAEVMKKSWSKLKSAKHELRNLRISPHRSMKDRKCYICCTKSKKLDCRGIRKLHTYSQRGENSGNKETAC